MRQYDIPPSSGVRAITFPGVYNVYFKNKHFIRGAKMATKVILLPLLCLCNPEPKLPVRELKISTICIISMKDT